MTQPARLAWLAQNLPAFPGTGVVYVLTKRDARKVSEWLNQNGISSKAYYSGIKHPDFKDSSSYRLHLEGLLERNELKALVATVAVLEEHEGISLFELQKHLNLTHGQIEKVLKYLSVDSPAPVVKVGREWFRTPVFYEIDHDHIQRLTYQREKEWEEVKSYVGTTECLMSYLCRHLDDPVHEPCGKCANCREQPLVDDIVDSGWTMAVLSALLRQAGSDKVFPVALASTRPGD